MQILVGKAEAGAIQLDLRFANRHGLIAGATGTGKTATLQGLAEGLSAAGTSVFLADVKGDLSGISQPGTPNEKILARAKQVGMDPFTPKASPAVLWDVFGRKGHPIRATISEMGPLLLARLLELNDTQEGALNIVFRLADDEGLLLLDLKDLRAMLQHVAEQSKTIQTSYGNVSAATIGAIQRRLLVLENQGAELFFGEPALDVNELLRTAPDGRGIVNVLIANELVQSPRVYATFLLWLLSELFENLPEVGDLERPKLVFFFDEAHLLFDEAPKALLTKVEQVVRLIRSKGVGVFFVTQNPADVPDTIAAQLSNRVQHALRAFTPQDQKAVRAAADTFRSNPKLDTRAVITELAVGEALVSLLTEQGSPSVVERTLIRPPASRMGPISDDERKQLLALSPVAGRYERTVDRESAFEKLAARTREVAAAATKVAPPESEPAVKPRAPARQRESVGEALAKSVARSIGSSIGSRIVRGILGSILKG